MITLFPHENVLGNATDRSCSFLNKLIDFCFNIFKQPRQVRPNTVQTFYSKLQYKAMARHNVWQCPMTASNDLDTASSGTDMDVSVANQTSLIL